MEENVLGSEKNPFYVKLDETTVKRLIEGISQAIFEKKAMPEPFIDINELSPIIDMPVSSIYKLTRLANSNKFPVHKRGGSISFKASEVEDWLNKNGKKIKLRRTD